MYCILWAKLYYVVLPSHLSHVECMHGMAGGGGSATGCPPLIDERGDYPARSLSLAMRCHATAHSHAITRSHHATTCSHHAPHARHATTCSPFECCRRW